MTHEYRTGPWLPIGPWREWLKQAYARSGSVEALAFHLGVSERCTAAWRNDARRIVVALNRVEDCLWRWQFADVAWTDIWQEDDLMDKHPGNPKKTSDKDNNG